MVTLRNHIKTRPFITQIKFLINLVVIISTCILFCTSCSVKTGYYVDSKAGDDSFSGGSSNQPWKTISKVNSHPFSPGDIISFKRGSEWTGELMIATSGLPDKPITYTAYGEGKDPAIKNPGVKRGSGIRIKADHIVVENFFVSHAHQAGIIIERDAEHNLVQNNEVTLAGSGISVRGTENLITKNYTHDLTMVVNDEGGDNDYGAVGVWIFGSNNEVSYNRMFNCIAPSFDYGHDGGVVEFYGDVDSCYIHHNWGEKCDGAFEVGGREDTLTGNVIAYNVFINNGIAGGSHVGGKFGVVLENMRIENNLFFETGEKNYAIGFWRGTPTIESFQIRNNIFYFPNFKRISNQENFTHEYNLYFLGEKEEIGIPPGPGEVIADPLFRNLNEKDYHLLPESPAIDAGMDLSYQQDFEGNTVPNGSSPDIGPFEFSDQ